MDKTKILEIIDKIKKGTPAKNFEDLHLDVKRYPESSQEENQKKKLASLLKEYAVAFANSEGGTLLLGIEDDIVGDKAITGCKNYDIEEMRRMVFDGTRPPIIIEIEEIALPEGIVLAVNVPKSPRIHSASSGVKHKRIGKENRILYPEDEMSLKVEKGYDYTAGYLFDAGIDSLDPLEISRLRNWLERYNPKSEILELKDVDLLKSLGIIREIEGTDRPTIAGLLLLAKEQVLKKFLPQNEIIYFRFETSDVDPVQSAYMKMPLLKTIEKIWNLIEPYNQVHTIKDAFLETPVPSFPEDVVREALLNAVVHRDYTLPDSIYVRVFSDRIEISNPGSFIGGVTPNNILTHPPVRRNPLLAEIFQHIGAVNRGGLGVDRMYRRLLSYGKLPPEYPEITGAVQVIIRNGAFDEAMAKFVGRKARGGHGWRLEELIVLHHLRRNDKISNSEASEILQRTQRETSEILSSMEGIFIERIGAGRGTYYQLTNEVLSSIGEKEKYTRIKGLSEEQKLQLLKNHLENNGRMTNEEARNICGVNRNQSLRLIRKLVYKGFIKIIGKGRGAYYEKC